MLKAFKELGGPEFKVTDAEMEDASNMAQEKIRSDPGKGSVYSQGVFEAILLIILNHHGYNEYSKTKELWNARLGLPQEKLEDTIQLVVNQDTA